MATIYYPSSASIYTRIVQGTGLTEMNLGISPNIVLMLTGSFPVSSSIVIVTAADTGSTYFITASSAQTASYALTTPIDMSLQGWWKISESSGSLLLDSSPYGRHGMIIGTGWSWVTGSLGTGSFALSLTTTSWTSYGTKIPSLGVASLCVWAKRTVNDGNFTTFLGGATLNSGLQFFHNPSNGTVNFSVGDGTNSADSITTSSMTDGLWHHYVGIIDRSVQMAYLYVDGYLAASASAAAVQYNEPTTYWLSNARFDGAYTNHGTTLLDDARIYSRRLSQAEITALAVAPQ